MQGMTDHPSTLHMPGDQSTTQACTWQTIIIDYAGMQGLRMTDHPSGLPSQGFDTEGRVGVQLQGNFDAPLGGGRAAVACHLLLAIGLVLTASQFTHLAVVAMPAGCVCVCLCVCVYFICACVNISGLNATILYQCSLPNLP